MCPLCYVVARTSSPCWRNCSYALVPAGAARSPFSPSPAWERPRCWNTPYAGQARTSGRSASAESGRSRLSNSPACTGCWAPSRTGSGACPPARPLARVFDGNGAVEPFTLCTAVHALLTETARSGPVLCWVDDVHWLDRASLGAMTFTARRQAGGDAVRRTQRARDDARARPARGDSPASAAPAGRDRERGNPQRPVLHRRRRGPGGGVGGADRRQPARARRGGRRADSRPAVR
jgi:hypothetical protein